MNIFKVVTKTPLCSMNLAYFFPLHGVSVTETYNLVVLKNLHIPGGKQTYLYKYAFLCC